MIISFYEEYPTKENLEKLNLINFPTKLYLAAHSFKEFKKYKKQIKSKYVKEIAYWPLLTKKEGYWFSAFTKRKALKRTISELKNTKVPVMWDAELPTHPNPLLYLTQLFNFFPNRKLINNFVKNHKKIYIAEYFFVNNRLEHLFRFLCLNFAPKKNLFPMRMAYSSLHDFGTFLMNDEIKKGKQEFKDNFIVAYGTLASGEDGQHREISLKLLKRDLDLAKKHNVNEVVLYRLGGLNKKYIKILKKY
jgi:hypothetical protein